MKASKLVDLLTQAILEGGDADLWIDDDNEEETPVDDIKIIRGDQNEIIAFVEWG